jgi:hypothetical protein
MTLYYQLTVLNSFFKFVHCYINVFPVSIRHLRLVYHRKMKDPSSN